MKFVCSEQILEIPEGVTVNIKARVIKVTGPRGELTKNLKHINVDFEKIDNKAIKILVHHGERKHVAALRTVKSLISNMVTGVTKGYKYKMRYVYAHFPINVTLAEQDGSQVVEIRNFLGQKKTFVVKVAEGVTAEQSTTQKDELILTGNSVEDVSQCAADIQQICRKYFQCRETLVCEITNNFRCQKQGYQKVLGRYLRLRKGYHRARHLSGSALRRLYFRLGFYRINNWFDENLVSNLGFVIGSTKYRTTNDPFVGNEAGF